MADLATLMVAALGAAMGAISLEPLLPTAVDAPTKAQYDDLSKQSGRDFDAAYLDAMVNGHEAAIRDFEQEEKVGQNAAIKGHARDELPMLREHLSLARKAQQEARPGVAEPQKQ